MDPKENNVMEQECDMGECLKPDDKNLVVVALVNPKTKNTEVTFKFKSEVKNKTEAIVDTDDIEKKKNGDNVLKDEAVERVKNILEKLVVKPIKDTKNNPLKDPENKKKNKGKKKGKRRKKKVIRKKCKKGKGCKR